MREIIPMLDIISGFFKRKTLPFFIKKERVLKGFEFVCKPSSVVYGHLSRLTVTDKLKRC